MLYTTLDPWVYVALADQADTPSQEPEPEPGEEVAVAEAVVVVVVEEGTDVGLDVVSVEVGVLELLAGALLVDAEELLEPLPPLPPLQALVGIQLLLASVEGASEADHLAY